MLDLPVFNHFFFVHSMPPACTVSFKQRLLPRQSQIRGCRITNGKSKRHRPTMAPSSRRPWRELGFRIKPIPGCCRRCEIQSRCQVLRLCETSRAYKYPSSLFLPSFLYTCTTQQTLVNPLTENSTLAALHIPSPTHPGCSPSCPRRRLHCRACFHR